uniref:Uncharacterized protein n=1 Tax=Micrurus lemniscatus lemniscatus TaxID=129467 RepID=A0A2D4JB00_MICLE
MCYISFLSIPIKAAAKHEICFYCRFYTVTKTLFFQKSCSTELLLFSKQIFKKGKSKNTLDSGFLPLFFLPKSYTSSSLGWADSCEALIFSMAITRHFVTLLKHIWALYQPFN